MSAEADVLDEVPPELVRRVEAALAEDRHDDVRALLADLSATGQASILEQVTELERDKLVGKVQERYGHAKEAAEKEVDDWLKKA